MNVKEGLPKGQSPLIDDARRKMKKKTNLEKKRKKKE